MSKNAKPEWVSIRSFAASMGCSHQYIVKCMDLGQIEERSIVFVKGRRKVIPDLAAEDLANNIDPDKKKFGEREKKRAGKSGVTKSAGGAAADTTDGKRPLASIRRDTAEVKLNVELIKLKQLKGELVNKAEVYSTLFAFAKTVRDQLSVIPDRIIDDLLAADTRADSLRILTREIESVLTALADTEVLDI